jgi:hypothetical protein
LVTLGILTASPAVLAEVPYLDTQVDPGTGGTSLACLPATPTADGTCQPGQYLFEVPGGSKECVWADHIVCCGLDGTCPERVGSTFVNIAVQTAATPCLCFYDLPESEALACRQLFARAPATVGHCAEHDCDLDGVTNDVDCSVCSGPGCVVAPPSADIRGGGGCSCRAAAARRSNATASVAGSTILLLFALGRRSRSRR